MPDQATEITLRLDDIAEAKLLLTDALVMEADLAAAPRASRS